MSNLDLLRECGLNMDYVGDRQDWTGCYSLYSTASGTLEVSPEQYGIDYISGNRRIQMRFRWIEGEFHDIFRFYEKSLVEVFSGPSKSETVKMFISMIEKL